MSSHPDQGDSRTLHENGAAPGIGRKLVACIVLGAAILGLVALRSTDALLAVLWSPIAAFELCKSAGAVTWLWGALIAISIALAGQDTDGWAKVFRQSVVAIAIGLTPHAVFLMVLNSRFGSEPAPGWTRVISGYETAVALLNDKLGDYLLPSFLFGTSISVAMFAITLWLDRPALRRAWRVMQESLRFIGLVLLSATMFTVMSAVPAGTWQPDARSVLEARLAAALEAEAKLALSRQALAESKQENSSLAAALRASANSIGGLPTDRQDSMIAEIVGKVRDTSSEGSRPLDDVTFSFDAGASRADARAMAYSLAPGIRDDERRSREIIEEIARNVGSGAAAIAEPLIGKLLAALLEDASTRLAREFIAQNNVRKVSGLLSDIKNGAFTAAAHAKLGPAVAAIKRVLNDQALLQSVQQKLREPPRATALRRLLETRIGEEGRNRSRGR
jgi:hypothetical protein